MDILLTLAQAASVVALTLVGLLRITKRDSELTKLGLAMLISGASIFILSTVIKEIETKKTETRLHQRIDEIFKILVIQVMKAPREVSPAPRQAPTGHIQITLPMDKSQVPPRAYVEGTVSDPRAKVWVIVHPMDVSAYWVQPSITVGKEGRWKVGAYFGRSGNIDVGKQFEIMAVANPKVILKEGDVLSGWPESEWSSEVVEVMRK